MRSRRRRWIVLSCIAMVVACNDGRSQQPVAAVPGLEPRVTGSTIQQRFLPPAGYERIPCPAGSFGAYLRALPLNPDGAEVHLYDGSLKWRQNVHAAVIDMSVGAKDLQQCADAVMRLHAEHLFASGRSSEISFHFTNGFEVPFSRWMQGERVRVRGNDCTWVNNGAVGATHEALLSYLNTVFTYAGSLSLSKELEPGGAELEAGDVFIEGGSPGHAMLVVDVAQNAQGEHVFLLAQSYMPAQEIHVVRNPEDGSLSPWFKLNEGSELETPEWTFRWDQRRSWP